MVKIIKKGNTEVTCPNCGCVFEYTIHDVNIGYEYRYFGLISYALGGNLCKYVKCPQCGKNKVIECL